MRNLWPAEKPSLPVGLILGLLGGVWLIWNLSQGTGVILTWITTISAVTVAGVGINVVTGLTGQIDLGHAAFLLIGGFLGALLSDHIGVLPALVVSAAAGWVIGILVGLPSARIRGIYLAVASLALFFVVNAIFDRVPATRFGHAAKISGLGDWMFRSSRGAAISCVALGAFALVFLYMLRSSGVGRSYQIVAKDELLARALGISPVFSKLNAFGISGVFGSLGGALLTFQTGFMSSDSYTVFTSINYLALVFVGGPGSAWGTILGAVMIGYLPTELESLVNRLSGASPSVGANLAELLYGLLIVVIVRWAPGGVAGGVESLCRSLRSLTVGSTRSSAVGAGQG